MVFLFQKSHMTSNLSGCTCSFQSGSTCADNDNIAWLINFMLLVFFIINNIRVDTAAQRFVASDTVAYAAYVTGDTFADISYIAVFGFVAPVGVGDESPAHADNVSVASCKDIVCNLRVADISDGNGRFAKFIPDSLDRKSVV